MNRQYLVTIIIAYATTQDMQYSCCTHTLHLHNATGKADGQRRALVTINNTKQAKYTVGHSLQCSIHCHSNRSVNINRLLTTGDAGPSSLPRDSSGIGYYPDQMPNQHHKSTEGKQNFANNESYLLSYDELSGSRPQLCAACMYYRLFSWCGKAACNTTKFAN